MYNHLTLNNSISWQNNGLKIREKRYSFVLMQLIMEDRDVAIVWLGESVSICPLQHYFALR